MTTPVRTKLRTEDRQAELVRAALQLAAERSPAEITTAELARAVGITQGAVFRHFESKEDVWLTVIAWTHRELLSRLQAVTEAQDASALHKLRLVFMAHASFVEEYPGVPRIVFQELQHARPSPLKDKVRQLMTDYRTLVAGLLAAAQKQGLLAPDADLHAASVLFLGAIQGLVMQAMVSGTLKAMTRQAQTVFNIYEAGLVARPAPPSRTHP